MKKTEVLQSLQNLPEEVSADEVIERILLLKRIDQAFDELREGKGIPHEQVMAEAQAWLNARK
jgi:hypothetical protein